MGGGAGLSEGFPSLDGREEVVGVDVGCECKEGVTFGGWGAVEQCLECSEGGVVDVGEVFAGQGGRRGRRRCHLGGAFGCRSRR